MVDWWIYFLCISTKAQCTITTGEALGALASDNKDLRENDVGMYFYNGVLVGALTPTFLFLNNTRQYYVLLVATTM